MSQPPTLLIIPFCGTMLRSLDVTSVLILHSLTQTLSSLPTMLLLFRLNVLHLPSVDPFLLYSPPSLCLAHNNFGPSFVGPLISCNTEVEVGRMMTIYSGLNSAGGVPWRALV